MLREERIKAMMQIVHKVLGGGTQGKNLFTELLVIVHNVIERYGLEVCA